MHIHWAWHEQSKPGICHHNRKVGREGRGRSRKIILVSLTLWHGGVSVSEIIDREWDHCHIAWTVMRNYCYLKDGFYWRWRNLFLYSYMSFFMSFILKVLPLAVQRRNVLCRDYNHLLYLSLLTWHIHLASEHCHALSLGCSYTLLSCTYCLGWSYTLLSGMVIHTIVWGGQQAANYFFQIHPTANHHRP